MIKGEGGWAMQLHEVEVAPLVGQQDQSACMISSAADPVAVQEVEDLAGGITDEAEISRFLDVVQRLPELEAPELAGLSLTLPDGELLDHSGGLF